MVRETRHLWVGNLPDSIREDRIREHFKRYGRVQNVKLLGRTESASAAGVAGASLGGAAASGVCATVAFMDIKSASKAHNAEHVLDERTLTTEYYEPAAIPPAASAPSAGSSPAGSGYSGSSSSVNSAPAPAPAPASVSRYHLSGGEEGTGATCALAATAAAPANWRGTNDSASEYCRRGSTPATYGRYPRNNSTAPYTTPPSNVERTTPHHRWYASGERGATGGESTPSTPGGGTESGRRRRSGSGSSRSESSSPAPSDASRSRSRASSPGAGAPACAPAHAAPHHAAARTPPAHHHQWASTANGRPLAICVRNLPTRSTDSSLKDGLYHEYKKHGKVVWVKVVGQNADRYAVVRFKKPSDVEKALEVSQDKHFFGCKISVAPHQSCDEDADSAKPYETDIDEYHPKATRTLFIGNLEKDVTQQQLRDKFKHFGRIIEIDIKKGSGGGAGYAFCQYASISSVVEAIRAMDGEHVGGSRVKLGFGKPVATACVWLDGLTEHTEKQVLGCVSRCGAATSVCVDRAAGAALVHFEQAAAAGAAVRELRRVAAQASVAEPDRPRLAVDYASRECQEAFYEQLEKHGGSAALTGSERLSGELTPRYLPAARHEPIRYDGVGSRSRASSYGRGSSRTPRFSSLEHYDPAEYAADRRYRVYDELGSSPQTEEPPFEDRLQSVVVSPHRARKHRRDSSPCASEDRKHSKDRHRSVAGIVARRSRSGSRGGERHTGRRRHRRRHDGSGSRAGTPLRDEPDAPPAEPRRPPRERPPLPMSLPLPKFAAQLLRTAPLTPRPVPAPAPAPDSPPRPPSASSSSAGSAPHSPSLEERIRSLDEKYEKWSGSRAVPELPDRSRLRHRLLEVDINEVKPSEVVRSLLAKRSVFDEDSERLEGAVRAPSPSGSPRSRPPPCVPRALRYPFPAHPPPVVHLPAHTVVPLPALSDVEADMSDRPADPRLNRPERHYQPERLGKFSESDYRLDSRIRLRTPSVDKPQPDLSERRQSPKVERERAELDRDPRKDIERRTIYGRRESESKLALDVDEKDIKEAIEKIDPDFQSRDKNCAVPQERQQVEGSLVSDDTLSIPGNINRIVETFEPQKLNRTESSEIRVCEETSARDEVDTLSNEVSQNRETVKLEQVLEKQPSSSDECSVKYEIIEPELPKPQDDSRSHNENKSDYLNIQHKNGTDKCKEILIQNHINKEFIEFEVQHNHLNAVNSIITQKEISELSQEFIKSHDKNGKERYNQNIILEVFHNTKLEKENIEFEKLSEKEKHGNNSYPTAEKKLSDSDKIIEDRMRHDRDKARHGKERLEKERHEHEKEKSKSIRNERATDKNEKEKKHKDTDTGNEKLYLDKMELKIEKIKIEKEVEKLPKEKNDRDLEKFKQVEEKTLRHDHHRKDKVEKDKKKEVAETDPLKIKKDEKHKHDRPRKDNGDCKRDNNKKDPDYIKYRKSSRDETSRDLCRKDSTDSSTSKASYDSSKIKDLDHVEIKEEPKQKVKYCSDLFSNQENEKELSPKSLEPVKLEGLVKIKTEVKEEKLDQYIKNKTDHTQDQTIKITEKQRHYSLDSPSVDCKRKERLNSCSSLPSHIGHKRRMSSQDSFDSLNEELKKCRNDSKCPERRDPKDSRSVERHKTTKFSKGHFAKIIESKTKDDKKTQVKPPDDGFSDLRDDVKDHKKSLKKSPKVDNDDGLNEITELQPEGLQNDLDFLATLELRSSEEDEKQKALRKEIREKKRIQQLQQIQELQMQQDALQHAELIGKFKDEKKIKSDDKKKDIAREKRMSTDRKSRDEKIDISKRKNRKNLQSSDTSDSDEPKKHSIFDIIDDEPTYISMYDKVKARSCKNMQKQEEEKRQEKIKAKFSQLKQSRAKREEKKRSSWDEDSDSENDRRKPHKISMDTSSEEDNTVVQIKKSEKSHGSSLDYDRNKTNDYFSMPSTEEDSRNKLSRKNSRTRIISDTSDDDTSKRSISKSPCFSNNLRKEFMTDLELLQRIQEDDASFKESNDKNKKHSLLNLFGKSDSDDSKLKSCSEMNDDKASFMKTISNDFSSESESTTSNRNSVDVRRKHKKKQKKHKFSFSDDENKIENSDAVTIECDAKHKNSEKLRRHSHKKDKRKDKIRESIDADDHRDDKTKIKKDKKPANNFFDSVLEPCSNNIKKEGKMEDIFGPLSDESDRDMGSQNNKLEFSTHDYGSTFSTSIDQLNNDETRLKEKDENRRKKDKRKKEKRLFTKDDENSLDVDAVSKAIEARLFADTMADDNNQAITESLTESMTKDQETNIDHTYHNSSLEIAKSNDKHNDKIRRECKERKKKKKKNKEERQSRKDHHYFNHSEKFEKNDYLLSETCIIGLSPKSILLDIPLPNDTQQIKVEKKSDDHILLSESPSLPRLTDSPPDALRSSQNTDSKNKDSDNPDNQSSVQNMEIDFIGKNEIEVIDIPMPPPFENIVQDISEVPLPKDPIPSKSEQSKGEICPTSFDRDNHISEDAVRCIPNLEKECEKQSDKVDTHTCKVEKKIDEKPRAIISQEETEDAVAALLGESFRGKISTFSNCYEEVEQNSKHQIEIESATIENENIPEEDAEEMRQAVQNLNASEMEIKPETPLSDNDLLLIDTDTEETDETPQDAIDRLPVNIIATNQSLSNNIERIKHAEVSNSLTSKQKSQVQALTSETNESNVKINEPEIKLHLPKQEAIQQITSTATPVITSWTLTNNKLREPHVLNIQTNKQLPNRETNESKPTHITANIVQIKAPQGQAVSTPLRPIVTPNRLSAPYQVLGHMVRAQTPNMQPPTIKIPEQHILYQKPPGIVISPRITNDARLQSPKVSPQGDGMTSPRLANVSILTPSPQNLISAGISSPNSIQQRSPGQVTVVRMQQPPLSPIQSIHVPHGARTMLSPNRPNSVLVQTQGAPIHYNRLPVTPVLAPISKQMSANNVVQQNKAIGTISSSMLHQQKNVTGDCRINNQKNIQENLNEKSKIILSPTSLQHSTNPTVMAQNRLISRQNAMNAGNLNSPLHLPNKVLINNMSEKRENMIQKSEQHNHLPFGSPPMIHVAGVNHSSSIIHSTTKQVMCTLQEANSINRTQGSNVIHTLSAQRIITTSPITNVLQIDTNKGPPSVLSMAKIRSPTVMAKLESSNSVAVTTNSLTNVVMTPLLLKTGSAQGTIKYNTLQNETDYTESHLSVKTQNQLQRNDDKQNVKNDSPQISTMSFDKLDKLKEKSIINIKPVTTLLEQTTKCETDFEELLKDNTNEIKITNDPEKKLEVNVGKTVTLFSKNTHCDQRKDIDTVTEEILHDTTSAIELTTVHRSASDDEEKVITNQRDKEFKDIKDSSSEVSNDINTKPEVIKTDITTVPARDSSLESGLKIINEYPKAELKTSLIENDNKFLDTISNQSESGDDQMKSLDENDCWSAKDLNIESVIKKVDSLCNDTLDSDKKGDTIDAIVNDTNTLGQVLPIHQNAVTEPASAIQPMDIQLENENIAEISPTEEAAVEKTASVSKRGGRSMRGKKSDRNQDRVQTRQISKPSRGGTSAKRGRGRAKIDKKIKSLVNQSANNIPGDVYDFHDDSGDETATSPNKTETRPRLILTIKSPISGQSNAIATSSLSITSKDQPIIPKNPEKLNKEDRPEDFVSPSANTRKSRRLQEKDVQRSTVDDVIEDVIKGSTIQTRVGKDANKKRQPKQTGTKATQLEKVPGSDTRKSPRGVKRTRDRSLSDASLDSSDEKIPKRDDGSKDAKVPKLEEPPPVEPKPTQLDPPEPAKTIGPINIPSISSTPIMKPPKKMISEISAKLASAFEAPAPVVRMPLLADRVPPEGDKQMLPALREQKKPELASGAPTASALIAAATSEARATISVGCGVEALGALRGIVVAGGGEAALGRRLDVAGGGMAPVGATEASDARVQSPALPHRPPSAHRLADRATPLLIRGGDGEGASVANVASGAGGARVPRGCGYAGTASLPRGAHLPAHAPPPPPQLPQHPHAKQVAVVGPHHHHHPATAASRVTITSVPTISPQGQIALGEGLYPHFSHQHYQMYQQHFRATQHESRATPSPYTRPLEAEGCEAPTPTPPPPLELRRAPGARVPRPAHSPSPADRHIMYGVGCGRSPPPAHGTSRLPGSLPPSAAPGPPHASQVPREADSLQMLLRRYPVMWQGLLALKNDSAAVQMHFVGGNPGVAGDTLPRHTDGSTPPLRIAQRMRLEPAQLDQVHRKMMLENEHCMLLALPCGRDHMDVLQQSTKLTGGFITYLQRKLAAGIVNVAPPGHHQAMYTVHIFPSCDFANENLNRIAPDLMHRVADIAHLLIIIATATV